ncbi:MAG: glycosyltransferase, partial [Nitrospirota bacterium]|nr:glycosyltransferase [Nitrospirota bacterium]
MMRVSVVSPLYNARDVIRETVQSVLDQTWQDFELLV